MRKKIKLFSLLVLVILLIGTSLFSNTVMVPASSLSDEAWKFIKKTYPKAEIWKVEKDDTKFYATLSNGAIIEFLANGDWLNINSVKEFVPTKVLVGPVSRTVKKTYPENNMVNVQKIWGDYKIKLDNNFELFINANGKIMQSSEFSNLTFTSDTNNTIITTNGTNIITNTASNTVVTEYIFEPASSLPTETFAFVDSAYKGVKIWRVERSVKDNKFIVRLANGASIYFLANGDWVMIDGGYKPIPDKMIDKSIKNVVNKHYSNADVLNIEKAGDITRVRLNNMIKFNIDSDGNVIEQDEWTFEEVQNNYNKYMN